MTRANSARLTTTVGAGSAALEIIAGASKGLWVRAIEVTLAAATTSVFGVGRPAAKGVTPTTPALLLPTDSPDPSTLQGATALAWVTPPTAPTAFYRQVALPATIGASWMFTFIGLWVPAGATLVLWNGAANSAAYVNIIADETN